MTARRIAEDASSTHPSSSPIREVRVRKATERLDARVEIKTLKPVIPPAGLGIPLKEIPVINENISSRLQHDDILVAFHRLIYGKATQKNLKRDLKSFKGFFFNTDAEEIRVNRKLMNWEPDTLRELCGILNINSGGNKDELMERVKGFLMMPSIENTLSQLVTKKGASMPGRKQDVSLSSSSSTNTSPRRQSTTVSPKSSRSSSTSPRSKATSPKGTKQEELSDADDDNIAGVDNDGSEIDELEEDDNASLQPHKLTTSSSYSNSRSNSNNCDFRFDTTIAAQYQPPQRKKRGPNRPKTARELFITEHKIELVAQMGKAAYVKLDEMWDALSKEEQSRYEARVSDLWSKKPSPATTGGVGMRLTMSGSNSASPVISHHHSSTSNGNVKTESTQSSTSSTPVTQSSQSISNLIYTLASQVTPISTTVKRKRGRPLSAATLAARAAGIIGPNESLSSRGIPTSQISITQYEVDSADDTNGVSGNGKRAGGIVQISPAPHVKRRRGRPPKQKHNVSRSLDDPDYGNTTATIGGRVTGTGQVVVESEMDDEEPTLYRHSLSIPPTDTQLINEIDGILKGANLSSLTNKIVRQKLEAIFSRDLTDRSPFIRQQISKYLDTVNHYLTS